MRNSPCCCIVVFCTCVILVNTPSIAPAEGNLPPAITDYSPSQNALDIDRASSITVTFDADMDEATLSNTTIVVTGSISGRRRGTINYNDVTRTATFTPLVPYACGDVVTVTLTTGIQSSGGEPLAEPFQWSFAAHVEGVGTGRFDFGPAIPVGGGAASVAVGDYNGDGFCDLATANYGGGSVTVIVNNGDGSFAIDSTYVVGANPAHLCAGDFNDDDHMDIAVPNSGSNDVTVLLNAGDGTFAQQPPVSVGSGPRSIFPFDADSDGDLDLATANQKSGDISILANDGVGGFILDANYPVADTLFYVYAADINQDGSPDMAVSDSKTDSMYIIFNNGDGTFAPAVQYYAGNHPRGTTIADLNADAAPDVIAACDYDNGAGVMLNNGDGTFGESVIYEAGVGPFTMGSGDVDGDGDLDLVSANGGYGSASVFVNNGSGLVEFDRLYQVARSDSYGNALADLDGDGDLDLAAACINPAQVTVLFNKNKCVVDSTSPPMFSVSTADTDSIVIHFNTSFDWNSITDSTVKVSSRTYGRVAGSLVQQGPYAILFRPDQPFSPGDQVIVSVTDGIEIFSAEPFDKSYTWTFTVAPHGGVGDFQGSRQISTDVQPRSLCATDLDGDGLPDIAVACATSNTILALMNNGDTTFTAHAAGTVDRIPYHITAADLDDDGDNDLITASLGDHSVSICYNDGTGTCESIVNITEGEKTSAVAAADFDGDGHIDLAAAKVYSDSVHVYRNDGQGGFSAPGTGYDVGGMPYTIIAADVDSDADQDMVLANYSDYNNGAGEFTHRALIEVFDYTPDIYDSAHTVHAADFNNDGFVDLAIGNVWSDNISVILNDGVGSFAAPVVYDVTSRPHSIFVGDFNADGYPDLAAADQTVPGYVSVLENNGDGTFTFWRDFAVGDSAHAVYAADIDLDGDIDLMTADGLSNTVSLLLNKDSIHVTPRPNPEIVPMGDSCMLEVEVRGDPDSVVLYYRLGGEVDWIDTALTSSDTVYRCNIATDPTGLRSTAYRFHIAQRDIAVTVPQINPSISPEYIRSQLTDVAIQGTQNNAYQMIGYPIDLDPGHPESLFVDDFGAYDTKRWRMGRWNPEKTPDPGYDEFPEIDSLGRGDGFWLYSRVGPLADASGYSALPDTVVGDTVYGRYELKPGWNQISTPFGFRVAWDHCIAEDSIEPVIYEYLGTDMAGPTYVTEDTLRPFVGYFIMNNASGVRSLYFPYVKGALMPPSPMTPTVPSRNFWQAQLSLEADGQCDISNLVGVRIDAADHQDKFDFSEPPPPPGEFVSLGFEGTDVRGKYRLFAGDFRQPASGWTFDLLLRGGAGKIGYLRLADATMAPPEFAFVLIDAATGQSFSIPRRGALRIPKPLSPAGVRYRLLVGDDDYIGEQSGDDPLTPDEYALYQNYPNPFNPATTVRYDLPIPGRVRLEIFNILGQTVATLIDKDMPAGTFTAEWEGRNRDGGTVASGIYIYRLTAGTYTAMKKMMLLR